MVGSADCTMPLLQDTQTSESIDEDEDEDEDEYEDMSMDISIENVCEMSMMDTSIDDPDVLSTVGRSSGDP